MKKIVFKALVVFFILLFVAIAIIGYLFYTGRMWFVYPPHNRFPVRGIDVSEHQGDIDWERVEADGFHFAFIKATEGMDHRDSCFARNWEDASTAGIARSAYHFFTFRSPGLEQARNFIAVVPDEPGSLPPTIDVEFGGNSREVPDRETFTRELKDYIGEIEAHYGVKPILYVTYDSYQEFIVGDYEDCIIWIRDLFGYPLLEDERWLFWQYNCRGRVAGIGGYVDLNVFNGDRADLERLLQQTADQPSSPE